MALGMSTCVSSTPGRVPPCKEGGDRKFFIPTGVRDMMW